MAAALAVAVGGLGVAACGTSSPTGSPGTPVTSHTRTPPPNPTSNLAIEAPPATPVALSEGGSSVLYPLWNLWVPRYHTRYPTVSITTASTDSDTGVTQALQGSIDIGASDAPLSTAQREQVSGALDVPLVVGAEFVAVNLPGLHGHLRLNGAVLSAIYRGQTTRWNAASIAALNPGVRLPATKIVTVHRADSGGDTLVFTQYLTQTDPAWDQSVGAGTEVAWPAAPGAVAADGAAAAFEACERTPGCVAYLPTTYLTRAEGAGLGIVAVANREGEYVLPTSTAIRAEADAAGTPRRALVISLVDLRAEGAYPMVNYEFAIILRDQPDPAAGQAIRSVLGWAVDPNAGGGAAVVGTLDFEPLPAAVAAVAAAEIQGVQ